VTSQHTVLLYGGTGRTGGRVLTQLLDRDVDDAARIMRIRPTTVRVLVSQARAVLVRPDRPGAGPGRA